MILKMVNKPSFCRGSFASLKKPIHGFPKTYDLQSEADSLTSKLRLTFSSGQFDNNLHLKEPTMCWASLLL